MKYGIVIILVLALLSCTDDSEIVDVKELRGSWVNVENGTDTLAFETLFEGKEFMLLKRAELYRTGPYEYKLLPNNNISIHWSLASTMTFEDYYFKVTSDKLTIGNFYDSPSGELLTFKKTN
ncbi:hypothetical protein [Algoriphagus pacificus]|uniref:DUF5640 domain-containing protein n=1 Tax=Algoriphagus pacificus TaxID=2811234 RepID=A0ABS3CL37_9BACT|nr:hypothetical protein [Algoriphagus pacificus]MBN7817821.1 hypothetical protein [Algoriphagus pacificus]